MALEYSPTRRHGYVFVRQSILDAAREIMRSDGVGALSLGEVARRVGMKTPSLYTYFESKHALYDALFLRGIRLYRERLAGITANHPSWETRFEAAIADYLQFADEHPDLYSLVFERPVPGFVPSPESLAEAAGLLEDGRALFAEAIASGAIRSGLTPEATRDLAIAVMHGLASSKRANEPESPLAEGRFGPLIPAAAALLKGAWLAP
jgi:AcrR family transcriptional regulator